MLLVDTNIWLAAADRSSQRHRACAALLAEYTGGLASTVPVIAETAWLLLDRAGAKAQQQFLAAVVAEQIKVIDLTVADWHRVHQLVSTYTDLGLDIIDASTMAVAERLNQTTIATLDERDFRVVRPAHIEAFELLPGPN